MNGLGAVCLALVRGTWPQLVTLVGFLVAVGLRFPGWFVILSIAVVGAVVWHIGRCLESGGVSALHDPLLGAVLVGSGLASIVLTLRWWFVEKQMQLPSGSLLYLAGHAEATTSPTLAWSSVLTQRSSCLIFLAIAAIWAIRCGRVD
ncbi:MULTISPECIES: hypothetical protein [Paraburkholderia]|uniref:Uncharacterized protein n=1 Tax=Paraburkholderia hospita TaxID=169430 RepID=A0AAJ4SS93_9BURK|nr:hypothetical protein [Paraburkholderia hospita]SKC98836.1 hypothetical protein SAMN05445504_7529 [Burkholderia sp. CF099]AUT73736.1 hypothetical protein C2L64_36010 [Paraburkholderia hospita]AXF03371.1 hypothetical protein CUJ88_33050 [Paraburkholderia hospita]OUL81262.1 hypothetical protein CA602_25560 [Paraburkholderia hospita]OUL83955.1 hypothetical protein CA601_26910 [Paraburkholderia hospita]